MGKKERTLISLEEKKVIQLGMLDEIDAFCRSNKIKYSLAFGTLLGAIRHRGYIIINLVNFNVFYLKGTLGFAA